MITPTKSRPEKAAEAKRAQKFKRPKPKPAKPVQRDAPMFLYTSMCCGRLATKTPCVKVDKKEAEQQGMGGWRCPTCGKPCKVQRTRNKQETVPETVTDASTVVST
jgi:hypothetical protein